METQNDQSKFLISSCRAVYRNFAGGGGKFGVRTKEGGRSLYEVLHPILAGGGATMTRGGWGGGGANAPPPLKYSRP